MTHNILMTFYFYNGEIQAKSCIDLLYIFFVYELSSYSSKMKFENSIYLFSYLVIIYLWASFTLTC